MIKSAKRNTNIPTIEVGSSGMQLPISPRLSIMQQKFQIISP